MQEVTIGGEVIKIKSAKVKQMKEYMRLFTGLEKMSSSEAIMELIEFEDKLIMELTGAVDVDNWDATARKEVLEVIRKDFFTLVPVMPMPAGTSKT